MICCNSGCFFRNRLSSFCRLLMLVCCRVVSSSRWYGIAPSALCFRVLCFKRAPFPFFLWCVWDVPWQLRELFRTICRCHEEFSKLHGGPASGTLSAMNVSGRCGRRWNTLILDIYRFYRAAVLKCLFILFKHLHMFLNLVLMFVMYPTIYVGRRDRSLRWSLWWT